MEPVDRVTQLIRVLLGAAITVRVRPEAVGLIEHAF